jgi:hypothetical protein
VDVLSLIPTHLPQRDRFRASFVCRHWRRTFLHNAALWSQLYLSKGEIYVKTLLERAKGSALDITAYHADPVGIIGLLSSYTKQIRFLDFSRNYWEDVQSFSEVNSGPLPLLTTLRIGAVDEFDLEPSLPLFTNAVNLKKFIMHSDGSPFLGQFRFPNLTTFELWATPDEGFCTSQLLDFLEASPMLQRIDVKIIAGIVPEDIPRERGVVLPNVETLNLVMNDSQSGYELAAHISCPSARDTSLMYEACIEEASLQNMEISPDLWNAIVRQYTRSPVEEITLEIQIAPDPIITCTLTFHSPNATVIRLGFKVAASDGFDYEHMRYGVFSQACRLIRDHPLLDNVRRLHINHISHFIGPAWRSLVTNKVGLVFKAVGPLEELTIDGCDLRSYLIPFVDLLETYTIEQTAAFPPVKELKILHPISVSREECRTAIVRLAKSQHALGVPFERVVVRMAELPEAMAEELQPWVGAVDCREEPWRLW